MSTRRELKENNEFKTDLEAIKETRGKGSGEQDKQRV